MPTPGVAQISPNAPCTPVEQGKVVSVCEFGVPADRATATFALIGDSHAIHVRAALEVVAQAKGWRGLSITQSHCAFSKAVKKVAEPAVSQCIAWNKEVPQWLAAHPEVTIVFPAQLTSIKGVFTKPGQDSFSTEVSGYMGAWNALPASVKHVIVMRDTPRARESTLPCVARAIARRKRAGPACALPRRRALRRDPAAVAEGRMRSPRFGIVGLTRFICGRRFCFPVVGGALVYKDSHHLTTVFATTLGPFVLRQVNSLMASRR